MIGRLFGPRRRTARPKRQFRLLRRSCRPAPAPRVDTRTKAALDVGHGRVVVTGAVLMIAFASISLRLMELSLTADAHEPRAAHRAVAGEYRSERADILDRNGNIIATSVATASLYADPRRILDADDAARRLARVMPTLDVQEVATALKADLGFVWLKRHLPPRDQWSVLSLGIPGFDFAQTEARVYPHDRLFAHVLGFTDIDNRGIAGTEQRFDEQLNAGPAPLSLSVDLRVQHVVREELAAAMAEFKAIGATAIVMDADSGEVVSLVSLPDFDPNQPASATDDARFNRATLGVYELGSTLKIFTTAMALDHGVVTLHGGYDATKPIRVARFTITDYHAKARWLSVPEIFIYSSNIGSAKMALDVGIDAQREFLKRIGLLSQSPIELPESGLPMVPSPWRPINAMTIAFGHGLAITPMHLTAGVAAMVNGGIYHPPTLIKRGGDTAAAAGEEESRRVISPETSREMRRLMRLAVENGTGRNASAAGYVVGGKTGTAEKSGVRGYRRKALISSFVAAFPMTAPRYVVFVAMDEPQGNKSTHGYATGGWTAAPSVRRIIERSGPLLGLPPHDDDAPDVQRLAIELTPEGRYLASY